MNRVFLFNDDLRSWTRFLKKEIGPERPIKKKCGGIFLLSD